MPKVKKASSQAVDFAVTPWRRKQDEGKGDSTRQAGNTEVNYVDMLRPPDAEVDGGRQPGHLPAPAAASIIPWQSKHKLAASGTSVGLEEVSQTAAGTLQHSANAVAISQSPETKLASASASKSHVRHSLAWQHYMAALPETSTGSGSESGPTALPYTFCGEAWLAFLPDGTIKGEAEDIINNGELSISGREIVSERECTRDPDWKLLRLTVTDAKGHTAILLAEKTGGDAAILHAPLDMHGAEALDFRESASTCTDGMRLDFCCETLYAPNATGSLTILLNQLSVACKFVESAVRKAGLAGILGLAGSANVQGEDQKKLDILANEVFINVLRRSGQCAVLVSEENDDPIIIEEEYRGEYLVVFDPLDGSSNIDCAVSVGTIFGIWKRPDERAGKPGTIEDVLKRGDSMVCAGYCLYGSSAVMVLGIGQAPSAFTLDQNIGEFVLTNDGLSIPTEGKIYSVNEGNASLWDEPTTKYVEQAKFPGGNGKPKSLRYVGSMVADVHRTILYGGIFLYPADKKTKNGKLRLLYEAMCIAQALLAAVGSRVVRANGDDVHAQCFPMAYLVEHAGGKAITGPTRILDILPINIHERRPIFLGSARDVEAVEMLYKNAGEHAT